MKSRLFLSLAIIAVFILADKSMALTEYFGGAITDRTLRLYAYYSLPIGIVLIASALLYGPQKVAASLGLNKGFLKGMSYGLLFTLPMFIGYASIGTLQEDWSLMGLFFLFIGATMEEVVYRGFLFGQLFRKANWGFIPAVLLNAVIFGIGHLYQGNSFGETTGVFLVTLLGGIWFAWLYIEWDNNLWVAISLHIFMNLSWQLFAVGDNALGGWGANFFRIMTIALSIIFTIIYRQQQGFFRINTQNLLNNKSNMITSRGKKQLANIAKLTTIILLISLFGFTTSFGQEKEKSPIVFGIQYYGELGLNPGIEIDYQHTLFEHKKVHKKRTTVQQIHFRPSITYYHLRNYTNNFLFTPKFAYQLKTVNNKTQRYFYVEPYLKFGYQRYAFIGSVYETANDGFKKKQLAGGNSFVFGGGLNFGGSIKPNKLDWTFGVEYLPEVSKGTRFIHHINLKAGIRFRLGKRD